MAITTTARTAIRPATGPDAFRQITPNWYASVMGTGIIAVAVTTLPVGVPGRRAIATGFWVLAVIALLAVTAATTLHWVRHPQLARLHHRDPVMAHFYGAVPMALLTIGAGSILAGRDLVGARLAVDIDWALWSIGTVAGLVTAGAVPYLMITQGEDRASSSATSGAFGGWLMPVVPPMVSAATGALLVPHAPAGQPRLTLLIGCYAMFGLSLVASIIVITLIWGRLVSAGPGPARLVPTLWIVLGPLGQSVTAANLLGSAAATVLPRPYASALEAFGVVYGLPVWGFALLWLGIAAVITARTARVGLPFSLTWWSFTFPVGTVVTGTSALALRTDSTALRDTAAFLFCALVLAWSIVAGRTLRGVATGSLLGRPAGADQG